MGNSLLPCPQGQDDLEPAAAPLQPHPQPGRARCPVRASLPADLQSPEMRGSGGQRRGCPPVPTAAGKTWPLSAAGSPGVAHPAPWAPREAQHWLTSQNQPHLCLQSPVLGSCVAPRQPAFLPRNVGWGSLGGPLQFPWLGKQRLGAGCHCSCHPPRSWGCCRCLAQSLRSVPHWRLGWRCPGHVRASQLSHGSSGACRGRAGPAQTSSQQPAARPGRRTGGSSRSRTWAPAAGHGLRRT